MSQIKYFARTATTFEILRGIVDPMPFLMHLRRYESAEFDARLEFVDASDPNAVDTYLRDGYQEIYLTMTKRPKSPFDWEFVHAAAKELMIIEGGRMRTHALELSHARLYLKDGSLLGPHFRRFVGQIRKRFAKGVEAGGSVYKNFYYERDVATWDLVDDLSQPFHRFSPLGGLGSPG